MISIRRIFALLLCVAILVGTLASCEYINPGNGPDNGQDGNGDNTQGDNNGGEDTDGGNDNTGDNTEDEGDKPAVVDPQKYEAKVRIVFASNDEKIKSALDAISSSSVICRHGKLASVVTESETDSIKISNKYTIADGVIYHSLSARTAEYTVTQLKCADFHDTDRYILSLNMGPGADITADDFEKVEIKGANYVCQDMKAETKEDIAADLTERLAAIGATVVVKSASYNLTKTGELDTSAILSCNLEITLDGVVYEVTMRTYTDYNYEADVVITAPDNKDNYTVVSYKDIIG